MSFGEPEASGEWIGAMIRWEHSAFAHHARGVNPFLYESKHWSLSWCRSSVAVTPRVMGITPSSTQVYQHRLTRASTMQTTAIATIDLAALRHNLTVIRARCPRSRVMVMVKANAYGHGLLEIARALPAAEGFAVARLQEARLLREHGIRQRVLLLATLLDPAEFALCSQWNIDVVAHDEASLECILAQARLTPLRVWLKLDTGMHRIGFSDHAFVIADQRLAAHPGILERVHMTHFSRADDVPTRQLQMQRFSECRKHVIPAPASLANSAALIAMPRNACRLGPTGPHGLRRYARWPREHIGPAPRHDASLLRHRPSRCGQR